MFSSIQELVVFYRYTFALFCNISHLLIKNISYTGSIIPLFLEGLLKRRAVANGKRFLADVLATEEGRRKVFSEQHGSPLGGHVGIVETIRKIRARYFWPGLSADINNWVGNLSIMSLCFTVISIASQ